MNAKAARAGLGMAKPNLAEDLVLPALLFAVLGGMTWAVRGCSGYGGSAGCLFAGITWGAAWWFIAHDPRRAQSRRYASGWVIPALAIGFAFSGNRGWMQWPSFFEGHLQTNAAKGEFVPISRLYGFLWLFIAGVPWAGIGACLLAWTHSARRLTVADWLVRFACAFGAAMLARFLFARLPDIFLPLHESLASQYADPRAHPNLRRLINDNRHAVTHLGFYLGCLTYELARRDWKNTRLILAVGILNGIGWALLQNWSWARKLWPDARFNFWRCWESTGGMSIGLAYGIAYYFVNRPEPARAPSVAAPLWTATNPDLERLAAYLGLLWGLGLSIRNGLKGWCNLYLGHEAYWNRVLWQMIGPVLVLAMIGTVIKIRRHSVPPDFAGDLFPHAYSLIWLVLITQNVLAQLVTGPWSVWSEAAFAFYYLLLFTITGLIIQHFHSRRMATKNDAS